MKLFAFHVFYLSVSGKMSAAQKLKRKLADKLERRHEEGKHEVSESSHLFLNLTHSAKSSD